MAGIVQPIDGADAPPAAQIAEGGAWARISVSHVLRQLLELRLELVADLDIPFHYSSMACNTYGVELISGSMIGRVVCLNGGV